MSDAPATPPRHMKFPYTLGAKLVQFPYKHYWNNNWVARFYVFGLLLTIPVFRSISKGANSPENVANWAEVKRKEAAAEHH